MWDRIRSAVENPVLVKHVRSRLRQQPLLSSLAVVILINLCLAYAGFALDQYRTGAIAGWIVSLQVVILTVMGAGQVNSSINGARASGILDFHRVTPMTPTELTLGFFFGGPIREYALVAATLPFTIICMALGFPTFRGFIQLMIVVLTSSWVIHAIVLLGGLVSKSKAAPAGFVGIIVFLFFFFGFIVAGAQFSVNVVESERRLEFFGLSFPWLPVVLLYQAPVLFFALLASTRKMESQRLHPLSRPQAIVAMSVFATMVLGGIWRQAEYEFFLGAALYLFTIPAIIITMMITPTQAEYIKGLHRAQKQGRMRLPWWDDISVNWMTVVILSAVVLAAGTVASTAAAGAPSESWAGRSNGSYPLALAAGVLTVAYFGFALQYFHLRFAKRGMMYFGLFLFVVWLLPLLAGAIHSMASRGPGSGQGSYPILAISPLAGIAMDFTIGDRPAVYAVQAASLIPILLFTFLFNSLLAGARRRVMLTVFAPAIKAEREADELPLAGKVAEVV